MAKVLCPCCRQQVSYHTRERHLQGGGASHIRTNAAEKALKFTSRVLDRFRKRRREPSNEEEEPPPKSGRFEQSDPLPSNPDSDDVMHDDQPLRSSPDPLVDSRSAQPPSRPQTLPTTRPRLLPTNSDESAAGNRDAPSGQLEEHDEDGPEEDFDPELDEALLEEYELSAADLLQHDLLARDAERLGSDFLDEYTMNTIRAHNFKVNVDLGSRTYRKLRRAFPPLYNLPKLAKMQSDVRRISGITPVRYHCCKESCCCFVGPYANLESCPYCDGPRYDGRRRPRAVFEYTPITARLKALFADKEMCEKLGYRARYKSKDGKIQDIFDSFEFRRLCQRHVSVDGTVYSHRFMDQDTDIAFGLSADGVDPFKNRKSTCWPLILVIYNLPPDLRFLLDHVLALGVIPGPNSPKDIDSYLIPLRDELWELMRGVSAFHAGCGDVFTLRAYLIRVFGDMPAMAKLMRMKGPNGFSPCRACKIKGVRDVEGGGKTYYLPTFRAHGESYDAFDLPRRTHDEFIDEALAVDSATSDAEAERLSKEFGINGLPVLATLSSLSFPGSFGHDLMHLIPENVIKNLLSLWTGEFKGLDVGDEEYELSPAVVEEIGKECVIAGDTTPAAFGARVPNLNTQLYYFTAESYTLWATLLAPVLLRGRFARRKYFNHFLDLISIFNDCLSMSISREYVDTTLRERIAKWVEDYERYYYQYQPHRLSVCTLTIHALLHIPDDILNAGPMWTYWNYVTERYVGFVARSSKSRRNPYASFARRLREIAQNTAIKVRFHLHKELDLSERREEETKGYMVEYYPDIRVLNPRVEQPLVPLTLKALANHLRRTYRLSADEAAGCLPRVAVHWGKISFLGGGDKIRAAELVPPSDQNSRDASFIKYSHSVDRNERFRHQPVVEERRVAYGQLLRLLEVDVRLPDDFERATRSLLLAVIRPVKILGHSQRLGFPFYQDGKFLPIEVVDVDDISCLVARIPGHEQGPRKWALCERQDAMGAAEDE